MLGFKQFLRERSRTPEQAAKVLSRLSRMHMRKWRAHGGIFSDKINIKEPEQSDRNLAVSGHAWSHAEHLFNNPKKNNVRRLPISSLVATQGHVEYDSKLFLRKQKEDKKPINVVRMPSGKHFVIDGHHRAIEAHAVGDTHIRANVVHWRRLIKHAKHEGELG
jgi:hypothetical protein